MSQAEAVEDDDGDNDEPHPLSHIATTPLSHNATHPLSHNATHTIEDEQQRITMEVSIEEDQPSHGSEPDQDKGVSGGTEGSVDDALYSKQVIEYARFTGRSLKQAQEHIRLGSAEPDQRGEAQEAPVDNGDYPDDVIEYAEMTGQTPQQVEEQARNAKKRMELRRARERGNDHNQPTTAYRPKPKLY
jgi:DNA-binding transcriptional MerR regulator